MQDEQNAEINESTALGQRPGRFLQCRGSLWFSFLHAAFISADCHIRTLQWEPTHPSEETHAVAMLCCGAPGARIPEKYTLSDHILSFCWTHPGNTDNYFLFHIKWPIPSDWRAGEKVVSLLQNEEKPVCLAGCEWSQPQKQLGTELQVAAPFHKPTGRGKAAQWVLVLWLLPLLSAVVTPGTISHAGKAGPALHPHMLLPCSNAQQSWNWV